MDCLTDGWGDLIVASVGDKREQLDPTQTITNVLLLECTAHVKLTSSNHRMPDLGVGPELGKGARQALRPRIKAAGMALVEDHHCFLVGRLIGGTSLLVVAKRFLYLLG